MSARVDRTNCPFGHEPDGRSLSVEGAAVVVFGRRPEGMADVMTEPENTGYQDSPDTTDPAGGTSGTDERSAELTTDDGAQHDDGVVRPGNEPD